MALTIGRYFVAVAAGSHAAPAAVVGLGVVVEPKNARRVFTGADEVEVAVDKEFSGGVGERSEDLAWRFLLATVFEARLGSLVPDEMRMALGASQEFVEEVGIAVLVGLAFFDERAERLAKQTRIGEE